MKIRPVAEIGSHRPPCQATVRVAAGLVTNTAQIRAYNARRRGLPVDQCGKRADYIVDGLNLCRPHAGAAALAHYLETQGA